MNTLLGIHGVWQYHRDRTADVLAGMWRGYLQEGIQPARDVDLAAVYYSPLLRDQGTPHGTDDEVPDALAGDVDAWLRALGAPDPTIHGAVATGRLRDGIAWVAQRYGLDQKLTRLFVRAFFAEVARYLDAVDRTRHDAVLEAVLAALHIHRPRVVVAHSLGSVVAYEALHADPGVEVELLLTLGSPLGMPDVVLDKLDPAPAAGRLTKPPGVRRWVNVADRGDIIAIPRPLSSVVDGIDVDLEPSIHAFDFHLARNYLRNPTTVAALAPYL